MKTQTEISKRCWEAYRNAIENFVKAQEDNQNVYLIRGMANVVRIRELELDKAEGKVR